MIRRTPPRFTFRRLLLVLIAAFIFETAIAPAPAQAQVFVTNLPGTFLDLVEWIREKAAMLKEEWHLNEIISGITALWNLLNDMFGALLEAIGNATMMIVEAMATKVKAAIELAQAIIDNNYMDMLLRVKVSALADVSPPKHKGLCRDILINQLMIAADDYEKEVSRIAAEGIAARGRCPGCDGDGPKAVALNRKQRCNAGEFSELDNPTDKSCIDTKSEGDFGRKIGGTDLMLITEAVTMPKIETHTYTNKAMSEAITAIVPVAESAKQKLWIAQWDYIANLVGYVPTPPLAKELNVPNGQTLRAMYHHCLATQNALVKQCTDRLAFFTRPDCSDAKELCEMQNERCKFASKYFEIKDFGNCEQGLSPYEAYRIAHLMCLSDKYHFELKQEGMSQDDLIINNNLCANVANTWNSLLAMKDHNCEKAASGLHNLDQCWAEYRQLSPVSKTRKDATSAKAEEWIHESSSSSPLVHKINATTSRQSLPTGRAISADEIAFPAAAQR